MNDPLLAPSLRDNHVGARGAEYTNKRRKDLNKVTPLTGSLIDTVISVATETRHEHDFNSVMNVGGTIVVNIIWQQPF